MSTCLSTVPTETKREIVCWERRGEGGRSVNLARNRGRRLVLRGDEFFFNELNFHQGEVGVQRRGEYERKERVNGREKSGGANERRGGSDSKRPEKNFSSTLRS